MPLWSAGNIRVVLRRGDGSESERLFAYPAFLAAYRRVIPDSCYRVSDSSGSRSRGRAVAVSDFFRGGGHPGSATAGYDSVMDMVIFRTIFFELLVFFTFTILIIHFAY